MRAFRPVLGLLLMAAAGPASGADKEKDKAAAAPKEQSVADYDSKTHGAVQVLSVSKDPVDWFDVLQNDKRAIPGNPPLLGNTIELAPGTYVVDVNRTRRTVTVAAGKKVVLWTGEVVVEGKGADWYIPYQGKDRKLVSNPPILNTPRALFPGKYTINVHVNTEEKKLGDAEVTAGKKTVLKH